MEKYIDISNSKFEVCINKNENKNENDESKVPYYEHRDDKYGKIIFFGIVDADDEETIWEFKCVKNLQIDHFLQVIVYAWLWKECMEERKGPREFKIINIRTAEIHKLNENSELINDVIQLLLSNRYDPKNKITDEKFIEKCLKKIYV
jgi:hypothetical protein